MKDTFFREATLEIKSAETGIMRLSFASELPVLRHDKKGKYWEILSHAPGDANLGFLNRNGVVLQDHDDTNEIGDVVRNSAKVDADKKTRAEIKICDDQWLTRAKTTPNEIPVSVGYSRLSIVKKKTGDDDIESRWYSWSPYEISLLTKEPADDTVGLNRSKVKRQCADCEGTGRCRCRSKEDDKADKDCDDCDGDGDCSACEGDGYFASARNKPVDSLNKLSAETIVKDLSAKQKRDMKNLLFKADPADGGDTTVVIDETKVRADERTKAAKETADAIKSRAKEIAAIADAHISQHGVREFKDGDKTVLLRLKIAQMANEALQKDEPISDFKLRCLETITAASPVKIVTVEDCTDERGVKEYSLMRGIQSCILRESKTPDGLEGEVHTEYTKRCKDAGGLGFTPQGGFMIPAHRKVVPDEMERSQFRRRHSRDMQATIFSAGGATVPTLLQTPIIELLRNRMVLADAGVRVMGGMTGNVGIPRQEAAATAYSVSEIGQLTNSQQVLGQIALTPKRVGATEQYSKQWLMQSSPDAEALVRDDLFKVIALYWDLLGINGQGAASQPLGVFNTPGIGAVTFGATPTYAKIVAMETAIRSLNVDGPLVYLSTPTVKGTLKVTPATLTGSTVVSGTSNALWMPGDMMNGYRAIDSNQIPNNLVALGEWSQLIQALWGGLDVVVDYWTLADKGEIKLTINTWGDFAVRHPQAFCVSTDAGNQ